MSKVTATVVTDPRVRLEMSAENAAFIYALLSHVKMVDIPRDLWEALKGLFGETDYHEDFAFASSGPNPEDIMIVRGPDHDNQIQFYVENMK